MFARTTLPTLAALVVTIAGCSAPLEEEEDVGTQDSELATHEVVQEGDVLRVTATALNVRVAGDPSARVVTQVEKDETLTVVATSGETGWVNIETREGQRGWVFGKYVVVAEMSEATCAPSRGQGVVGRYQKALHDAIAYAEGTRNRSKDGYDVMFSFVLATSCVQHPNECHDFGNTCSTAAGRYQMLKRTWDATARARGLTTFEPENQERGAAYLVTNVRRVTVPIDRPMTASEFSNAMSKLSYEWASLPPGRYGQPNRTMTQMRSMYCDLAGC